MNNCTHLIITRFMCNNFIEKESNEDIFSEEWKNMSFDMAKRHIIPTLENQTNKDFTLVFLVSDNISDNDIFDLEWLSGYIDIKVIKLSEFNNYIKSIDSEYLITSRLDYDDHIYKDCVKDIHNLFLEEKPEVMLYGLREGISVIDGESDAYLMWEFPWLFYKGYPAPMVTLMLKKDAVKEYFDIYKLGFHTEVVENLLKIQSHYLKRDYSFEEIYRRSKTIDLDYIWIRHHYSATALIDNVYHTSNIKIDITKEELKEIFGYTI